MLSNTIYLKDYYEFLGEDGKDAKVSVFLSKKYNLNGLKNEKNRSIIICPGGGYNSLSEREAEPIAFKFLNDGYNIFILWYSVSPNRFPSQLLEVAAVVDLIYKNEEEWNCDTNHIAIMGFSAGGHLAAHYSNCYDIPEVRNHFPNCHNVNVAILSYPVISLKENIAHKDSFVNLYGITTFSDKQINDFSLENTVNEKTPPTYIWHTAEDSLVNVGNSILYAKALSENKIPFELHIFPFGYHGLATVDEQTNNKLGINVSIASSWISEVKDWLNILWDEN